MAAGPTDWSGFYLGVSGGYAGSHMGIVTESAVPPLDGLTMDFDMAGGLLGATAGVNLQSGNLVFGIEGDLSRSNVSGDADPINLGGDDAILTTHLDWLGTLRGRVGFASDSLLLFVTGGLAAGGISGVVTNFPVDGTTSKADGTQYGYVIGAGLEAALTEAISVKAEVLHVDLGTAPYDLPPLTANAHPTANIVRVGLNYRF
jgi:outer membrane immunogenic protein